MDDRPAALPGALAAPEFTDRIRLQLVPRDEPNSDVLRDLVGVIRAAQKQCDNRPPPATPFRKPKRDEAVPQAEAVARGLARIDQIAAASEPVADELKARVVARGPGATTAEVTAGEAAVADAVRWLANRGMRVGARPVRE